MINRVYDSATITLDGSDAESWRVLKGLNVVETISKASDYRTSVDVASSTLYVTCAGDTFSINNPSLANAQTAQDTIDGFRTGMGSGTIDVNIDKLPTVSAPSTQKAVTNTVTVLFPENLDRKMYSAVNNGPAVAWVKVGGNAEANVSNGSIRVAVNGRIYSQSICETDEITAITASGIANFAIQEA